MTDLAEEISEKIELIRENLGCHMCSDYKAFATTVTVCNKCRNYLKKSNIEYIILLYIYIHVKRKDLQTIKAFATTVTVCNKCRNYLKKSNIEYIILSIYIFI